MCHPHLRGLALAGIFHRFKDKKNHVWYGTYHADKYRGCPTLTIFLNKSSVEIILASIPN